MSSKNILIQISENSDNNRFIYAVFDNYVDFKYKTFYTTGSKRNSEFDFESIFELNNKNEPHIFIIKFVARGTKIFSPTYYKNFNKALQAASDAIDQGATDFEILRYGCVKLQPSLLST